MEEEKEEEEEDCDKKLGCLAEFGSGVTSRTSCGQRTSGRRAEVERENKGQTRHFRYQKYAGPKENSQREGGSRPR